ncbi:MAG TPA: Holliday junction resolvase RuvX [Casimicrobiaceae bacterium]|nr:Holliday junction resolvase RuvX [Casimicrobiaceae bacterium]
MSGTHEPTGLPAPTGTVLAFDFGTRKIGVAVGNTISGTARPLVTLHESSNAARFAAIGALIADWAPVQLVVGRPLHADAKEHAVTALAAKFARDLERRFALPVACVDERYTTQIAQIEREGAKRGRSDPGRDAIAARIILQAWLDEHATSAP